MTKDPCRRLDLSEPAVSYYDSMSLFFRIWRLRLPLIGIAAALLVAPPCLSQELEPRRWSHLPTGMIWLGGEYTGSVLFEWH